MLEVVMRRSGYWVTPLYSAEASSRSDAVSALGQAFDTWLERKLHAMFDSTALEPLPADLLALVNQIDKKDASPGDKK